MNMNAEQSPILTVSNLSISLTGKSIVENVSFVVPKGKVVGIVGNSGSGKSVTAHAILGLLPNESSPQVHGQIHYGDAGNILSDNSINKVRGQEIAMIFQEALAALNPTMKIGKQILEAVLQKHRGSREEAKQKVIELLRYVGIPSPEVRFHQYPFELSGGMRQRVVIAIALACDPNLLIADEPTTALDVTIEAQVMDLLRRIQREKAMSILIITHDLSIVAGFCDTVYVMQEGRIVDSGDVDHIFYHTEHPYTLSLLASAHKLRGSCAY